MKRAIALLLSTALIVSFAGCDIAKTTDADAIIPEYNGNSEIWTFADCPAASIDELVKDYFDAGFTSMVLIEAEKGLTNEAGEITQEYKDGAALISKYGSVLHRNLRNYPNNWQNPTATYYETNDEVEYLIPARNITTELNSLGNVLGYYQCDEPKYTKIDTMVPLTEWQNAYANDKLFHVNLYPSYAGNKYVGESFEKYIRHYTDTILAKVTGPKTLCIDNYPLQSDSKGNNYLRSTYLSDLLIVATVANEYNKKEGIPSKIQVAYCIQAFDDTMIRDVVNQADIDFQINTCLAMGAVGFEYFLYQTALQMIGMVETGSYEHRPVYDFVKNANTQLKKWDQVITEFDWQGLYLSKGKDAHDNETAFNMAQSKTIDKLPGVTSVNSRLDTVIGAFKDENDNNGYMVTNYTEPSAGKIDIVSLDMPDINKALVYQNGERTIVSLEDGRLSLTLGAGQGAFVIPCK